MFATAYCWAGLGLYVVLSAADFGLTWVLLKMNPSAVESNPVAAEWLARFGWGGLAVFKAATVLVFVGAVVVILRRRRAVVGAGVVTFGCAALLAVTVYSGGLIGDTHDEHASPAPRMLARLDPH